MLARLGVTKEQPYFEVDNIEVFCLWDPLHLIKNIRTTAALHWMEMKSPGLFWKIYMLTTTDRRSDCVAVSDASNVLF